MKYFDCSTMSLKQLMETWDNLNIKERRLSADIEMGIEDALTEKTLNFYRNAKDEIKAYVLSKFNKELGCM